MRSVFFLSGLLFSLTSLAQQLNVIKGFVKDKGGNPVQHATVTLLIYPDTKLVRVTQTDSSGLYFFENIEEGKYLVLATAAGMKINQSLPFDFFEKEIQVPDIIMSMHFKKLKEVKVNTDKKAVEATAGKIVYNVEKSIVASGSSAFELLQKTPGINIDQDENILLKGNSNVNVMIDGRMIYMTEKQLSIYLKSLPAENISRLEIITVPSSQFDAAGNTGIINIVTKKSNRQGYALNVSAGAGTGRFAQTSDNIIGNIRKKKINLYAGYDYRYKKDYLYRTSYRVIPYNQEVAIYDRSSYDPSEGSYNSYKAGMDIYLNKNNLLAFSYSGFSNLWSRDANGPTYVRDGKLNVDSVVQNHNITREPSVNSSYNISYQVKLDTSGKQVTADVDYAYYKNNSGGSLGNSSYSTAGLPLQSYQELAFQQPNNITIHSIKSDALLPFKKVKFTAGLKYSYVTTNNNFVYDSLIGNRYQYSQTLSNHFIYDEKIYAAYISVNKQLSKTTTLDAGLRAEKTISIATLVNLAHSTKRIYTNVFPYISLSRDIRENSNISFSLTRRINRPAYSNLNPSRYFFDKYSYYEGNPYLRPEYSWNGALTYTFKSKYILTLSYSGTNHAILGFATQDSVSGNLRVSTYNFSHKDNYDALFIVPVTISKFWEMQNTVDLSHLSYVFAADESIFHAHKFIADIATVQTFNLPWKSNFELTAEYSSPAPEGVYLTKYYFTADAGWKKSFFNKKLDSKISVTDIFKTIHYWGYSIYNGANVRYNHTGDTRRINLNLTYHFGGKLTNGKQHALEETKRL